MYQSFLERTDGFSVGTFCSGATNFNTQTWIDSNAHALGIQVGTSYIQYIGGKTCTLVLEYTKTTDAATTTLSAQSDATIKLANSALDLSNVQFAPVTAASAGSEITKMNDCPTNIGGIAEK